MKQKIVALWASVLLFLAIGGATANDFAEAYLDLIEGEGFTVVSVSKTWLGRVQIESQNESSRRETVFNPLTGELLQDMVVPNDHVTLLSGVAKFIDMNLREGRHGQHEEK